MLLQHIWRDGPIWYGAIRAALADVDGCPVGPPLKHEVPINVSSEDLD